MSVKMIIAKLSYNKRGNNNNDKKENTGKGERK